MTQQGDAVAGELATEKVGIKGYLAFFLTIIFFSGVFSGTDSWWRVFDFSVLNGSFGQLPGANGATTSFRGAGGAGAKDGFLFALELAPVARRFFLHQNAINFALPEGAKKTHSAQCKNERKECLLMLLLSRITLVESRQTDSIFESYISM